MTKQRILFLCIHAFAQNQLADGVHELLASSGSWTL